MSIRSQFELRPYSPSDLDAIRSICVLTGAAGQDATGVINHPELLPAVYAEPYLIQAPQLGFVVVSDDGVPHGYVLGTPNVREFREWASKSWWPALQSKFPKGMQTRGTMDEELVNEQLHGVHAGNLQRDEEYPAELHINLLPSSRGQGAGARLIEAFLDGLRALGVGGVQLGADPANERACGFYEHLGFLELVPEPGVRRFTMHL